MIYFKGYTLATSPLWLLGITIWEPGCILFEILGAYLHLRSTLGAIWAPQEHLGELFWHHPGRRTWKQQDGFDVANKTIFVDVVMICGFVFISFWNSKCLKSV